MHFSAVAILLLASATAASTPLSAGQMSGFGQVLPPGQTVLRIPNMPPLPRVARTLSASEPQQWVEKKGPNCIDAGRLGGAIVNGNVIDLVMRGGERIRALIGGDCGSMGYYGGVYFKPWTDGKLCAGRDSVRTRSGVSCKIRQFRKLVAKR